MSEAAPTLFAPSIEQQAVRDRGHASNVLVAAAGSGKTRVLTWLYCDAHVREGIGLDALLAITFTDKAAGELRRRIATELESHTLGREPDLSEAWIGTFHGVCTRILREFAHRRGLDPAFGVIEELQALELQAEAWDDAVAELLEAHGGAAASLLSQVGDTALRGAIVEWWKARRSAGEVHPELPAPRTTPEEVANAAQRLMRACDRFSALVEEIQEARPSPLASLGERLQITQAIADAARSASAHAGQGALTPSLVGDLSTALQQGTPRRGQPLPKDCEELEALVERRAVLLRRLAEHLAAPRVALLGELVAGFSRRYEARKRTNELLDFDDLELEALQLLREDDDVRLRLVERFERVLVDEFQDTNPRQAELVDLLAGGPMWIPVGGDGRPAVTVVGDPRQAIYGFRYADVGLIASATDRINEGGDLRLSTNYRSDAEVLTAIDEAFAKLDPGHEPVQAHRGPDQLPAGQARVELLITKEEAGTKDDPKPSWTDEELGARPGEAGGPALAEARLVAARIQELRTAEPERSIVVLARARSVLHPIAEALIDLEIPALIDGAEGFWERLEVVDLLAWLRVVRNPADDAALIAVCASPLIGLSTDGLAAIGILGEHRDAGGRAAALRGVVAGGPDGPFTDDDAGRLRGLLGLLDRQRRAGRAADPAGLLDEVIAATRYDEHLLRLVGGDRRMANVVRLRRLAAEIAAAGGDLTDVVERAEKEQGHALRAPEASVAGSDAVTLMTVHQAKGLEFDSVIVAGLGSRTLISSPALLGDAKRLGLKLRPSPGVAAQALFDHDELTAELQQREDDELRRVLYVALTRARERLIVSGVARWTAKDGSPFSREPTKTAPVLQWLAPALVPELDQLITAATAAPQRSAGGIELRVSTPDGSVLPPEQRAPAVVELAEHVGPGPRLGGLPDPGPGPLPSPRVLSYSALAAHRRCGLRFHAEHVLGLRRLLPPAEAIGAPAGALGTAPDLPAAAPSIATEPQSTISSKAQTGAVAQLGLFDVPELPPQPPAPVPPQPSTASRVVELEAGEVGTAVHAALERLTPEDGDRSIDDVVRDLTVGPQWEAAPEHRDEVGVMVRAALAAGIVGELWSAGAPRRELPFTIAVGTRGHLLTGVLDAWSGDASEVLVVDYKTDRVKTGTDLARKTSEQYTLQRQAYALAALRAGAQRVRVVHLFLRDPAVPVEATFTAADAAVLERDLVAAIAAVEQEGALATASPDRWTCDRCPARGSLCGWTTAATERPPDGPPASLDAWHGTPGGVRAPEPAGRAAQSRP